MAARGCGASRTPGAVYVEVATSPFGEPLENFLVDPPKPVDQQAIGLEPRGVQLLQLKEGGPYHVFDIVGRQFYPNVADYVEEAKRLGASRKLNPKLDFSKLTPASKLVLLHARAYIANFREYASESRCRFLRGKLQNEHSQNRTMCARLWWEDVELTPSKFGAGGSVGEGRAVTRVMPEFTYEALSRPGGVEPKYRLAIFAVFPIGRLAVVNDPKNNKHEVNRKAALRSNLEVVLVDE